MFNLLCVERIGSRPITSAMRVGLAQHCVQMDATGRPALHFPTLRRSQVALMLTHLVKVPLMLRPAAMEDILALMLLQGNSGAVPQVCALPSLKTSRHFPRAC